VCGDAERRRDHSRSITWRGHRREEGSTGTSRCLRRDAGIVGRVIRLVPCTSPQTYNVPGGIRTLTPDCMVQGTPSHDATCSRWCWCGPRCQDERIGCCG
jgi:hypothetical protein